MRGIDRLAEISPSPIRKLYDSGAELSGLINLAPGEPDFSTPQHILDALRGALDKGDTHYCPSGGLPELRKAIASHYREFFDVDVAENQVIVTHGSTQGLFLILSNLLGLGDEVIVLTPAWFGYRPLIEYSQGTLREVPLRANGWGIDEDQLKNSISPKSRLLIMCSPNNPTGGMLRREDLEKIVEVATEHRLTVIADEIYNRIVYEKGSFTSLGTFSEIRDQLIIVNGFSKTYAMTGVRLGYLIVPDRIASQLTKIQGFSNVCVSPAIQRAGIAALTGPQGCVDDMVAEYDKRRRWLVKELNAIQGVSCELPPGAFYAFPKIAPLAESSENFAVTLLKEHRVVTVPGSAFGSAGEGHLRISYATSNETLKKGIDEMRKLAVKQKSTG